MIQADKSDHNIKVVDLTYLIQEGMPIFGAPWHAGVSIRQLGRIAVEGRETREVRIGTHTGTHMDAPLHFIVGGKSIDNISLDKLIGKVSIIDYSHLGENQAVTKDMLSRAEIGKRIIFKFGWGKYWNTKNYYKGYPFFTPDAVEYIVLRGVELMGMDTPSPDDSRIKLGSDEDSKIHKYLLNNGVILLEYLANLEELEQYDGWHIIAMPMKIQGADGSPARVCLYRWEE